MGPSWKEDICSRIAQVRLEVAGPRGKARFAKQLGISPSTYDYYESSRVPPADVLVRIAEVAGVDIGWLLTGSAEPGGGQAAIHPVVRRAAGVMARSPEAAAPLAAFIELLAEVERTFPSSDTEGRLVSEEGAVVSDTGAGEVPIASVGDSSYIAGESAPSDAPEQAGELAAKRQWVPILGRSAAGVPQFWGSDDRTAGLTTLAELVVRHAERSGQQIQPAMLSDGAADHPTQVISLRRVAADEIPEYVCAGSIKADYPDAFAVRIDGNSMSPEIAHGDLVILSPSAPAIDGRAAVVQLVDQIGVTCKLFRRQGDTVHLVPINEELGAISVRGSDVVWALRVLARVRPGTGPVKA